MNMYWNSENECQRRFDEGGPFWMVTTEDLSWLLFKEEADFVAGTNMTAVSLAGTRLALLNEVMMNNHLHWTFEGPEEDIRLFTRRYQKDMHRYQTGKGSASLLNWDISIKRIEDLNYLRNALIYISRNPSVARRNTTPVGYRWSGGHLMFNETLVYLDQGVPCERLSYRQKREICHARNLNLPNHYRVWNGMVTRASFIDYRRAESFFNSAHQYFRMLAKNVESDAMTAKWIGERILIPNEDVCSIVCSWFSVKSISLLTAGQREEAARKMKYELSCNNKQIAQVLKLDPSYVNNRFPCAG